METNLTSVIVPCWNIDDGLVKLTERFVSTLRDTCKVELIIIDNGSTMSSDFLKYEADIYIRNNENKGYVFAVNQGLHATYRDHIVVANNDIAFTEGWLQPLKEIANQVEDCGVVLPYVNDEKAHENELWEEALVGSCFLIHRKVLDKVGFFDQQFFNRYGDADYALRLWELGLKIYVTPKSHVYHKPSSSLNRLAKEVNTVEQFNDMVKYVRKWRDHPKHGKTLRETIGNELCQSL